LIKDPFFCINCEDAGKEEKSSCAPVPMSSSAGIQKKNSQDGTIYDTINKSRHCVNTVRTWAPVLYTACASGTT
jgi:hypothetical protein